MSDVTFRRYDCGDAARLAEVYREAVMEIGPEAYGDAQVAVWARYPEDSLDFLEQVETGFTIVAECGGRVVAFGQLDPVDKVSFLYCIGSHSRRGIGSRIYGMLEDEARAQGQRYLMTDASRISRPMFEKQGFSVIRSEEVVRNRVSIERFFMEKELGVDAENLKDIAI